VNSRLSTSCDSSVNPVLIKDIEKEMQKTNCWIIAFIKQVDPRFRTRSYPSRLWRFSVGL
jgi:hypothetical protein